MTTFIMRAHKSVYLPANIEVEANTFKEAAVLGMARVQQDQQLQHDHPNWTDRINDYEVTYLEIWREGELLSKKRNLTVIGRNMIV